MKRRTFLQLFLGVFVFTVSSAVVAAQTPAKILIVVAHPDDEYYFAATTYCIAKELHGTVDELIITNGEGGFHYSTFAEAYYDKPLTNEVAGRRELPAIRREEALQAGKIIGIRDHYFLDQKDEQFTTNKDEGLNRLWNTDFITSEINVAGGGQGSPPMPGGYFGPFHFHNLTGYTQEDYLTEVLSTKAEEFLDRAAPKGPFFLYLAEYAVHIPLQEREALVEKYKKKNGGKDEPDPVYAAMVESVDTALGRLRGKLESLGVAQNTIIILTSDNGGVGFQGRNLHRIGDDGPLRAGKGFLYEGGIREPLIILWPGVTRLGSVCNAPVIGMDFTPTLLRIAQAPPRQQPCDGVDFSGLLHGEQALPPRTLYWHYPHYSDQGGPPAGAVLEEDWKLVKSYEDDHLELYNLALDQGEQYDLSSSYQDKALELNSKLVAWLDSVNAVMPKRNPQYDAERADNQAGAVSCSVHPVAGCGED